MMSTLPSGKEGFSAAVKVLQGGGIVGLPTDTVYGLAAVAFHEDALLKLFDIKLRPSSAALPLLVADLEMASRVGEIDGPSRLIAETYWPGGLTLVVPKGPECPQNLGGDGNSVGVRVPNDDFVRALIRKVGPLAATSANRHGEPPCVMASELASNFDGEIDLVIDDGIRRSPSSSVVAVLDGAISMLRHGSVTQAQLDDLMARSKERSSISERPARD